MTAPFSFDALDEFQLSDLQLSWTLTAPEGATATAITTIHDFETAVLIALVKGEEGRQGFAIGFKPVEWPIAKALPALDHPALDGISFDRVALVVTDQEIRVPSGDLTQAARDFYQRVYAADEFDLVLTPGLNLVAAIPTERLGPNHPLNRLFARLGIESGAVLLQGTLGQSLAAIGSGAVSLDLIKDVLLRAMLPKMRPSGSPAWFKSGQLGLEITGAPSVGFVGEITVVIDDQVLTFSIAAKIEKDGAGAAIALVGGLVADEPWVKPFGVEWLVFYHTILKLSVDMKGNIGLGFAAKMIIGEKDLDVAVAVKVNSSGVPTNFLCEGESEAGISLADLVALQACMREARPALPGTQPPPPIPLDQLPPMEIRHLHLKFAPKDDPDLGVERGLALRGEFYVQLRPGEEMTDFAGVDFSVDDHGIVAKAHLGAFAIGPVSWDDAELDLELTLASQHLIVHGAADLGFARQEVDVSLTRAGAFFDTATTLVDRFHTSLHGEAPFTRDDPVWTVRGELDNDFNGAIQDLVLTQLRAWAADHERAVAAARQAYDEAKARADRAAEHLADLEASLDQRQADAKAAMDSAARVRDAAAKAVERAEAEVAAAERRLNATPARNVRQKAERKAEVVKAKANLAARKTALAAKQAEYVAAKAAYDALGSKAIETAQEAANQAEAAAEAAKQRLAEAERMVAAIESGQGTPIVVDHASFAGRLDALSGGTVDLALKLRVFDHPDEITVGWGFDRLEEGARELVNRVVAPH